MIRFLNPGSILKNYSQFGGKSEDLGRTQNYLENAFHSGAAVCLICIGSVKRTESVISMDRCNFCKSIFLRSFDCFFFFSDMEL